MRTVLVADPLERANVLDAFAGGGRPAGVRDAAADGETVAIAFDDALTATDVVDELIAVARAFVPARGAPPRDAATAAAIAARGLGDPELDASRILETYLP